jgi:hypothetical protein
MSAAWTPRVLREYALLADGERGVLVGPEGEMVWLCFPRWDSAAVFAALVGAGGGYQVVPVGRHVWGGSYEPDSLIWRSRWVGDDGVVESRDALALPGRRDRLTLLRRVTAERDAAVRVRLAPRADFGRVGVQRLRLDDAGVWHGTLDGFRIAWSGVPDADVVHTGPHHDLEATVRLAPGRAVDLVLTITTGAEPGLVTADDAWAATEEEWRQRAWAGAREVADRDVRHAHAVLSGMTSSSGAMVAAATMGLPERADRGRNYDYRYAWIRDQCFAGVAAAHAGNTALLDAAVRFVTERVHADGPALAPAYTVAGEPVPSESALSLPGYPGGAAVAGNHVNDQFQLDVHGEVLQLFSAADAQQRLDADGWSAAAIVTETIADRWHEADAGIWELDAAEWTESRLACVGGLRTLARRPGAGASAAEWSALADAILADASARCLHPSGRWQRSPADGRVDAALLLPGIRGALPTDDPRTTATLHAVLGELTQDGYAYRFRHGDQPLPRAEGAFLLCGFLVALALADQHDLVAAARWFERNRAACGPPGLFTEEFDVGQRQLRGNLPQAFVHALLVETAHRLGDAMERTSQTP